MNMDQFYNVSLENDLLSILICNQELIGEVLSYSDDIFYHTQNKVLYKQIKAMWLMDNDISTSTIYAQMGTDIKNVGGISRITELENSFVKSSEKIFNQILDKLEQLRKRRYVYKLNENITESFKNEIETKDIINKITNSLENLSETKEKDNGEITEALERLAATIEDRCNNKGKIKGIETKLIGLDKKLNGLNKQELLIIAARPGQGKTTLANNIALRIAQQGKYVALFNLEMSKEQILDKMLSTVSMIDNNSLKYGLLTDKDFEKIGIATNKMLLLGQKMKVFDSVLNLNEIISNARKLKKKNKLDAIIVDYLQLIEVDLGTKNRNREQEVSTISRKLKLLSKELQVPVIALSQLSRSCEQRADKRPMLSDLRESGAIEQDADIVMFCYRDEYYNPETEERNILEIIVAKNRNGTVGTEKVAWLPQFQKVADLDFCR